MLYIHVIEHKYIFNTLRDMFYIRIVHTKLSCVHMYMLACTSVWIFDICILMSGKPWHKSMTQLPSSSREQQEETSALVKVAHLSMSSHALWVLVHLDGYNVPAAIPKLGGGPSVYGTVKRCWWGEVLRWNVIL